MGNFARINQSLDGVFPYLCKCHCIWSLYFLYSFVTCVTIGFGLLALCIWILTLNTQKADYFNTKPIEISVKFTGGFQSKKPINKPQGGKTATFEKHFLERP